MRCSNGLRGITATLLVLLMGAVAIAQPPASSKAHPTSSSPQPRERSSAPSSMICDFSGQVCIAVGKRGTAAPVATPSLSPVAAPGLQPSKDQAVGAARAPLICDSSGKICASSQTAADSEAGASSKGKDAASASQRSSAVRPAAPPETEASRPQLNQPRLLDHAAQTQIDGISVYDTLTSDDPFNWVVHASKSQHRIEVYFKGQLYKTYHAVFGRSLAGGAKLWEGDRRTPEGNYLIVGKRRSTRFGWFLHLNYPNERDHERFEQSRATHLIPASAHEGGQIGIHGTDSPYLNVAEVDWTTGCISVDNTDISELARLLPIGTLVIINP
jgi:lipoprotein-anchoring transpeptidase ErfK/SrfK